MKKYSTIIFDLDGTITDPVEGIINSVRHALMKFDIEEPDSEKLKRFIGPPLNKSFENHYGFPTEKAKQAVDFYREYYAEKGIYELQIYAGIIEVLSLLSAKKCRLFVGTSKPTNYAKKLLKHFEIDHFFEEIVGSNMDLTRVKKNEILEYILNKHELISKEDVLMVGDTQYDIEGANYCGIHSLYVEYGYGDLLEVMRHNPTYSIKTTNELYSFFDIMLEEC
ncbi:MAG: HAD family hydrolase [Promethearchaeota archaeon]|nr:MAG: HAD family hydrolase [Candidatus Lokiarchaeota archaeon]